MLFQLSKKAISTILFLSFAFSLNSVFAQSPLEVTNAIIKIPVVSSVTVTAAFMNIKNTSDKDLKIVGAKSDFAGSFELHSMEMKEGKMKMRTVDSILLKAKAITKLESGGLHLMVFDLKDKLDSKKKYEVQLILENKQEVKVSLTPQTVNETH